MIERRLRLRRSADEPETAPEPLTADERIEALEQGVAKMNRRRLNARTGFLLAFVCASILGYAISVFTVNENRQGCERLDVLRASVYTVLQGAVVSIEAQVPEAMGEERQGLEAAGGVYQAQLDLLDETTAEFRDEDRGAPHIDCTEAYPYPPPL